jgi:hypothetical protein
MIKDVPTQQHHPAEAIAAEPRIHLAATTETARSRATEALTAEYKWKQQQTGQIAKKSKSQNPRQQSLPNRHKDCRN